MAFCCQKWQNFDRQVSPVFPDNVSFSFTSEGGIRVICSRRITGTDLGTVALVISSFTTATDLVSMVITKCKAKGIKAEEFCVVMETGYKEKSGGLETQVLKDEDNPLEIQAQKPKGQVRFGVQLHNGVVVKVYDGRIWPVSEFGDVYITAEFTTQLVIHHMLSSSLPRKQLNKYTLALGTTQGKIHRFLNEVEQPIRVLQQFSGPSDDVCFLIVKKPKAAKKPMFRSLSWASVSKLGQGHSMNRLENNVQNDGKKQKKYRLKKKNEGRAEPPHNSDSTSSEEYLHQLTSTPIKRSSSVYASGERGVRGNSSQNGHPVLNGSASDAPLRKDNFALSGMPQNSSLTLFYSCNNIDTIAPQRQSTDSDSEMSSTETVENKLRRQPPQYSDHILRTSHRDSSERDHLEEQDTLSDLQVVLRTRSLGDLTANQGLSLAEPHTGLRESWQEGDSQMRYIHSAGSSRTVTVNQSSVKRDVPRPRQGRQNRRSCVARIEDKENRDYLEDFYGRSLQKTPRQRRSLPQIPNNDIDEKKKRLAELMMRRLTVCNGEIATYLQDSGHFTGSLNEIRDGRYISSAHIHLTPNESLTSQTELSAPDERDFDSLRNSPVPIISSPRSPHSLLMGSYNQPMDKCRRRTPDPFNDSPKLQRMPLIQERDSAHTPLSRIAKSEPNKLQYQIPRSRTALVDARSDRDYPRNSPPSYSSASRYLGNNNLTYNGKSPSNDARRNLPLYLANGNRGNSSQGYHSNSSYGTMTRGQPAKFMPYSPDDPSHYSTFPRSDKNQTERVNHRGYGVMSPGKTLSENASDPMNIVSRGSMVDSGYGTNGESDYGAVPNRPYQPHAVNHTDRQGILKSRNPDLKNANGSFERNSLESPSDPVTFNPAPSLHQLLSMCNIHPVKLFLPPNKMAADLIHIHEESIHLPFKKSESDKSDSPKGKCVVSLGGPGSAFRRIRTNPRDTKCYNLVCVESLEKVSQPKQGEITMDRGDFLIEINGRVTMGMDFSSVLSILESQQGGQLDVVVARKRPVERVPETLTSEISKLRQQCSYLITEVKSKERIITDLSTVGPGETTPPLQQQQPNLTLDPPIQRQEAYYTCELSEDEFIV